jgi:hypothetical protein
MGALHFLLPRESCSFIDFTHRAPVEPFAALNEFNKWKEPGRQEWNSRCKL